MAFVNILNWQAERRSAGILFDLQRTPYVVGTDGISSNPKKVPDSDISAYNRGLYLNWAPDSVFKINSGSPVINNLELETSSVVKYGSCAGEALSFYIMDSLYIWPNTGHQHTGVWSGGDGLVYKNVTIYQNQYAPADTNGDGILEDYWDVATITYGLSSLGAWTQTSYSVASGAGSPTTTGLACAYNGNNTYGGFFAEPNNSIYGEFSNVIYANEFASLYAVPPPGTPVGNFAAFCARKDGDSAHGLKEYISYSAGGDVVAYNPGAYPNLIFSVRESTTENAVGTNNLQDTTCRWYYTPASSCPGDCWYAGKTVTVQITYKEASLSRTVTMYTEGEYDVTYTLGSWATHSTVTQTLVLPSGFTRQAINAAFDVPTKNGYVVAIDDIKLVSVT